MLHKNHTEVPKVMPSPKRISVEEAQNGYTVSMYHEGKGEMKMVFENMAGALKGIEKMMGSHKGKKMVKRY